MEVVFAVVLAAATGLLVGRVGATMPEAAFGAFARLVGGYRPDGWPRGIQEEDRDRPWARAGRLVVGASLPSMRRPDLTRVRPTVRPR